jgi:hypothetical protein
VRERICAGLDFLVSTSQRRRTGPARR